MHPIKLGIIVVFPIVIAIALLDNGSKPTEENSNLAAYGSAQVYTEKDYARCLATKASIGAFSSYDGGNGAVMLTSLCDKQWQVWIDLCKAKGTADEICSAESVAMAQGALKLAGR
ncbi:MAG: hypothetical protein V4527_14000 [Pseudomonadota bacterium]